MPYSISSRIGFEKGGDSAIFCLLEFSQALKVMGEWTNYY
jgi:hypothetical protein